MIRLITANSTLYFSSYSSHKPCFLAGFLVCSSAPSMLKVVAVYSEIKITKKRSKIVYLLTCTKVNSRSTKETKEDIVGGGKEDRKR